MSDDVTELIRKRRSYPTNLFMPKAIDRKDIEEMLENANWAPNHKKTEPWRFKIFHSETSRSLLSTYLSNAYKNSVTEDKFSEIQQKKISEKPLQSACAIAICLHRHEDIIAEWEEVAAVACAVQNIWLTCTSKGLGCFWATPGIIINATDFLGLTSEERCLGLLYIGYVSATMPEGSRNPIDEKIKWM